MKRILLISFSLISLLITGCDDSGESYMESLRELNPANERLETTLEAAEGIEAQTTTAETVTYNTSNNN